MTFREKIWHLKELAEARRQSYVGWDNKTAAMWEVKRDTYNVVLGLWDDENASQKPLDKTD